MDDRMQQVVQECVELLRQGSPLDECLSRYPERAEELEPMLKAALAVQSQMAVELPSGARVRIRNRVLDGWDHHHQPRRWSWRLPSLAPRSAFIALSIAVALVLGGIGTDAAQAGSVPGDMLYPVKELREGVKLWFARSPEAKIEMYTSLVHQRVEEVQKVAAGERADLDAISDALARMNTHLAALNGVVEKNVSDRSPHETDADSGFLEALQRSLAEQRVAGELLTKTLDEVPGEAAPAFRDALEVIQLAQNRVNAALEAVGPLRSPDHQTDGD